VVQEGKCSERASFNSFEAVLRKLIAGRSHLGIAKEL
jgi:hypothetical protein